MAVSVTGVGTFHVGRIFVLVATPVTAAHDLVAEVIQGSFSGMVEAEHPSLSSLSAKSLFHSLLDEQSAQFWRRIAIQAGSMQRQLSEMAAGGNSLGMRVEQNAGGALISRNMNWQLFIVVLGMTGG
jgi:hypothetical protein